MRNASAGCLVQELPAVALINAAARRLVALLGDSAAEAVLECCLVRARATHPCLSQASIFLDGYQWEGASPPDNGAAQALATRLLAAIHDLTGDVAAATLAGDLAAVPPPCEDALWTLVWPFAGPRPKLEHILLRGPERP